MRQTALVPTAELDYERPLDCDVAIAGAGLGGLVAGAILAREGRRVVVVDAPPVIGGRGGSAPHRGYWIDSGHRLGRDTTDLQAHHIWFRSHGGPDDLWNRVSACWLCRIRHSQHYAA